MLAWLAAPILLASPTYPDTIEDHLALTYEPPCSVCHSNGVTGLGTVNTPFGVTMRTHGLVFGNPALLRDTLDDVESQGIDSDDDGTGDVAELRVGTDPNLEGATLSGPAPEYGCGARIAPIRSTRARATGALTSAVAAMLLALALRRR